MTYAEPPTTSLQDPYLVTSPVVSTPQGVPRPAVISSYGAVMAAVDRPSPYPVTGSDNKTRPATKEERAETGEPTPTKPTLTERVQAKRTALTPFGSGLGQAPPGLGDSGTTTPTPNSVPIMCHLEEDDDDDLEDTGQDQEASVLGHVD